MQKFSKTLLGLACAGVLVSVPVVNQISQQQATTLKQTQKINQNLKNSIYNYKHDKGVKKQTVKDDLDAQKIQKAGQAVGNAEIEIAKANQDANVKKTNEYQKAYGTVTQYVNNDDSWQAATTPWLSTDKDIKCQFIFGALNSDGSRQVAWIFTNGQNQPVNVVTGEWCDFNLHGTNEVGFYDLQLYQSQTGGGLGNVKPVEKPNTQSAASSSSSSRTTSNSAINSSKGGVK